VPYSLAFANILFLVGLPLIIGPQKTLLFFARKEKWQGTAAFAVGIILILLKWAFVGFLVEGYGVFVLFGGFLVTIAGYAEGLPVVGPFIKRAVDMVGAKRWNSDLPV
jgi:Got1/Sft2-like family